MRNWQRYLEVATSKFVRLKMHWQTKQAEALLPGLNDYIWHMGRLYTQLQCVMLLSDMIRGNSGVVKISGYRSTDAFRDDALGDLWHAYHVGATLSSRTDPYICFPCVAGLHTFSNCLYLSFSVVLFGRLSSSTQPCRGIAPVQLPAHF